MHCKRRDKDSYKGAEQLVSEYGTHKRDNLLKNN